MSTTSQNQSSASPKSKVRASIVVYSDATAHLANGTGWNEPQFYPLNDNSSVLIGSDDTCGIRLKGDKVAPKHSMLQMAKGEVSIGDWYSEIGTFVNNKPINQPTKVEMLDQITIGTFRLRVVVHPVHESRETMEDFPELQQAGDTTFQSSSTEQTDAQSQWTVSAEDSEFDCDSQSLDTAFDDEQFKNPEQFEKTGVQSAEVASSDLHNQLRTAQLQIEQLEQELEYQRSIQEADDNESCSFDDEEKELLREEVVHLQTELAQREQELAEAMDQATSEQSNIAPSETGKLVERLEELLDELQSADQRVLNLEDMLRASDEAYQTERESHKQIEEWITELEKRVASRDEEWQAREERLKAQLEIAREQHKATETRITKSKDRTDAQAVAQEYEVQIVDLRTKAEELSTNLDVANCEIKRLNQLIEKVGSDESEIHQLGELKHQLREKELELSQKSAELSHQRAELTKMRDEMESLASEIKPNEMDEEHLKIRAFREHLREIHEQDKIEKQERSLATRISRLWNRLDRR